MKRGRGIIGVYYLYFFYSSFFSSRCISVWHVERDRERLGGYHSGYVYLINELDTKYEMFPRMIYTLEFNEIVLYILGLLLRTLSSKVEAGSWTGNHLQHSRRIKSNRSGEIECRS